MLRNYLLVAWRNLLRQRLFTLLNVAGLAIGLASCIVIGLYVHDELSFDRFHTRADRIFRVGNGDGLQTPSVLGPALTADLAEVAQFVRFRPPRGGWLMRHGDKVFYERRVYWMDATAFDVFSFRFLRGNPRTALADPYSVVLTQSTARRYFGDQDPVGQVVRADDEFDLKVTGVVQDMPANAHFHLDFMIPMEGRNAFYDRQVLNDWHVTTQMYTYVLLAEGATRDEVEARLPAFTRRYLTPQRQAEGYVIAPFLQPLSDIHLRSHFEHELEPNSDVSYAVGLVSIAALILLVACVNFTNLATARFALRAREVGVRKSLGSTAPQLTRQFLSESVLVAAGAALLALLLAGVAVPFVNGLTGKGLTLWTLASPTYALAFVVVVLATGLLAGAYPSFYLARFRPAAVLKASLRTGRGAGAFRRVLVVAQFGVSAALIVGTMVVSQQLRFVSQQNLGFDKERVLVVPLSVQMVLNEASALRDELRRQPAVTSVAQASTMPGRAGSQGALWRATVRPEGWPAGQSRELGFLGADLGFRQTLGLQLAAGRWLDERDAQEGARPTVLVNEAAVRAFGWGTPAEAIGRELENVAWHETHTVIGVLADFHFESLHREISPMLVGYVSPDDLNHMAVRLAPGPPADGVAALRAAWNRVFPQYPLAFSFLDQDFEALYRNEQRLLRLFGGFALLAVLTACVGVFGLVTFATESRTREIGVRKALGASARRIVLLLSWEILALVLVAAAPCRWCWPGWPWAGRRCAPRGRTRSTPCATSSGGRWASARRAVPACGVGRPLAVRGRTALYPQRTLGVEDVA